MFLLLNAFLLNGLLWLASPSGYQDIVLYNSLGVLQGRGLANSWRPLHVALEYAEKPHLTPLYSEVFFNRRNRFQYPPTALFALSGLLWLGGSDNVRVDSKQVLPNWPSLNDQIAWGFLLAGALATAALLEVLISRDCRPVSSVALLAGRVAIVLGLAVTFYPLVKAYTLGQIQV